MVLKKLRPPLCIEDKSADMAASIFPSAPEACWTMKRLDAVASPDNCECKSRETGAKLITGTESPVNTEKLEPAKITTKPVTITAAATRDLRIRL